MEATKTQGLRLRRLCAGCYETQDGRYTINYHPGEDPKRGLVSVWVCYQTADPIAADSYETLRDAKAALALQLGGEV